LSYIPDFVRVGYRAAAVFLHHDGHAFTSII
jgi:hypothetical protein